MKWNENWPGWPFLVGAFDLLIVMNSSFCELCKHFPVEWDLKVVLENRDILSWAKKKKPQEGILLLPIWRRLLTCLRQLLIQILNFNLNLSSRLNYILLPKFHWGFELLILPKFRVYGCDFFTYFVYVILCKNKIVVLNA